MLPVDLIAAPGFAAALARLPDPPPAGPDLLVLYPAPPEEPVPGAFLLRILGAAGYDDVATQLHLLPWSAGDGPLDLTALIRHLAARRVLLFGQDLPALGLHFRVVDYLPLEIGGVRYLTSQPPEDIEAAKARGDNGPAGRLWAALQQGFLAGA